MKKTIIILLGFILFQTYSAKGQKRKVLLDKSFMYSQDSIVLKFNDSTLFNQKIAKADFLSNSWATLIIIPNSIKLQNENIIKFKTYGFDEDRIILVENQCLVMDKRLLRRRNVYFLIGSRTIQVLTLRKFRKMDFQ